MPYETWKRAREKLRDFGFAIERINLQEQTVDVWISEVDFSNELKDYPALQPLLHLSSSDYKSWRDSPGNMYLWFKDFPEYVISSTWTRDTYYYRWNSFQAFKIPEHHLEEWKKITKSSFESFYSVRGFLSSSKAEPLINYDPYCRSIIQEEKVVKELHHRFRYFYGASIDIRRP